MTCQIADEPRAASIPAPDASQRESRAPAENAVTGKNLIVNGDMESDDDKTADAWKDFKVDARSVLLHIIDGKEQDTKILRVTSGPKGTTVDGGNAQKVEGLSKWYTYRISGKVRSS